MFQLVEFAYNSQSYIDTFNRPDLFVPRIFELEVQKKVCINEELHAGSNK